ncbi:MAG: sulfatase-like hydrolase/transferase, partial [Planctomycetota bacterium]
YVYIENGLVVRPASQRHKSESLPNLNGKWRWDNDEGWMADGYRFEDADLLFYDRTVDFIRRHRRESQDRPFFVLLSTQIAHAPVLPAAEFRNRTPAGPRGDFVVELDVIVGRLLDTLKELKIDDETLVIVTSDNGPETVHTDWMRTDYQHDPAGGFRGMKRDGWEGGHRVPMIARWPGSIPAGQVSEQLINTTDVFATLASIVGESLPDDVAVDSFDMLPVLLGRQPMDRPVRPHMLTQSFRGEFQLRVGDWKYLHHRGSGGNDDTRGPLQKYALPESAPDAPGQLYNLKDDPGERTNLYFTESEQRRELQERLEVLTNPSTGRTAPINRTPEEMP